MKQPTSPIETSKILRQQSRKLCAAAKGVCIESKEMREGIVARGLVRQNYRALNRTGNSLTLKIFLERYSYDCLLEHISRNAPSHPAINAAVLLGNTRVIDCDDAAARDLLACARIHCPDAVRRITEEMLLGGLIP